MNMNKKDFIEWLEFFINARINRYSSYQTDIEYHKWCITALKITLEQIDFLKHSK